MKRNTIWGRVVVVAASLLVVAGLPAAAQLQTGNLYGKIVDQQGTALPGVTVTLDTGAAQEVQVSNAQGEVRFLSLPPGSMKMKSPASLSTAFARPSPYSCRTRPWRM